MFRGLVASLLCVFLVWGAASAAPQNVSRPSPAASRKALPAQELAKRKELLASRVTALYNVCKAGEWRKAEQFMTEDSKDIFYGQAKNPILDFAVKRLRVEADGMSAVADVEIKFMPGGFPNIVALPQRSNWVYQDENWFVKMEQPVMHPLGPFMVPQAASLNERSPLQFEKTELEIRRGNAEYVFRFQNAGKETLTVKAGADPCGCMDVALDKTSYAPGESGEVRVTTFVNPQVTPQDFHIQVLSQPGAQWNILTLKLK